MKLSMPNCYCFVQGLHALVYDMGTAQETWEWVNLKEVNLILNLLVVHNSSCSHEEQLTHFGRDGT
jgi:hypothetical protein